MEYAGTVPESTLSILFELFAASQKTRLLLGEAMVESPLSPTEYAVYSLVFDVGSVTPTDMAERMGLPVTTLLDHLHEMQARGHITRSPNPTDGRSYFVSLTAAGLGVHQAAGEHFQEAMTRLLDALETDEATTNRVLRALGDAADSAHRNLHDSQARSPIN